MTSFLSGTEHQKYITSCRQNCNLANDALCSFSWCLKEQESWTISTERQQWNRWQFERNQEKTGWADTLLSPKHSDMQCTPEASALFVSFYQLLSLLQAVEVQSQLHQGRSILRCILVAIPTMWTVRGLSVWIPITVYFSTSLTWILNIIVTARGTMWLWVTDKLLFWYFRPNVCVYFWKTNREQLKTLVWQSCN